MPFLDNEMICRKHESTDGRLQMAQVGIQACHEGQSITGQMTQFRFEHGKNNETGDSVVQTTYSAVSIVHSKSL